MPYQRKRAGRGSWRQYYQMSIEDAAPVEVSPAPVGEARQPADALVVLGARLRPEGTATPVLRRRVAKAAALWRRGAAPVVIVSGGIPPGSPSAVTEAAAMAELLTARHRLPASAVVQEDRSADTLGNARETLALAAMQGWRHLILVTDAIHMRRALGTFRHVARPLGIAVEGRAAAPPRRLSAAWWAYGLREAAARVYYALRLRLPRP